MMGDYKNQSLTVDTIIFDESENIILIKRKNNPYKDHWALPGGFVEYGETVENAAIRETKEETNIDVTLTSLVNVYSKPDRDPRGHTVTVAYIAKGDFNQMKAADDACDIKIFSKSDLKKIDLAFDHAKIIEDAFKVNNNIKK